MNLEPGAGGGWNQGPFAALLLSQVVLHSVGNLCTSLCGGWVNPEAPLVGQLLCCALVFPTSNLQYCFFSCSTSSPKTLRHPTCLPFSSPEPYLPAALGLLCKHPG